MEPADYDEAMLYRLDAGIRQLYGDTFLTQAQVDRFLNDQSTAEDEQAMERLRAEQPADYEELQNLKILFDTSLDLMQEELGEPALPTRFLERCSEILHDAIAQFNALEIAANRAPAAAHSSPPKKHQIVHDPFSIRAWEGSDGTLALEIRSEDPEAAGLKVEIIANPAQGQPLFLATVILKKPDATSTRAEATLAISPSKRPRQGAKLAIRLATE